MIKKQLLFEFTDKKWFPEVLRSCMTDYLRDLFNRTGFYKPVAPVIAGLLYHNKQNTIVDLCSGAGGNLEHIQHDLHILTGNETTIVLTDKYPNIHYINSVNNNVSGKISYYKEPVDAGNVPVQLQGTRTIFSGFHHFNSDKAREILQDCVKKRQSIAIFDGAEGQTWLIFLIPLIHIVYMFFGSPFIKPFKVWRLIFTYLLPLIPLCTIWDGMVSVLNVYDKQQLHMLTKDLNNDGYVWTTGMVKNKFGIRVNYLTGYPA